MAAESAAPRSRSRQDLVAVVAAALACYALSVLFELHERYFGWLQRYERWQADELPLTLLVLAGGLVWYAFRRRREALAALRLHERAEARAAALLAHNRELAQGLIALQENERRALARELHDEMGQHCTALRVETALLRRCASDDVAGRRAAADRADLAAQAIHLGVRDLLQRLRPAHLDALGLQAALQELCEAWERRSGIACLLLQEGAERELDDAVAVAVYRIVQEALTNVLRHAGAGTVRIRLRVRDAALTLEVADDGCGMDPAAATRGLGLLGARERAAALGGELAIDSTPGAGLRLTLVLPLARPRPPSREASREAPAELTT